MNKNLYRVVFNKARGMLMAVAEITTSQGKSDSPAGGAGATRRREVQIHLAKLKLSSFAVQLALGASLINISLAHAQIVTDTNAPKNQQPTVLNTASGVTQVNIQTPSAAGVSRNTYSQFDVQRQGAILNNARNSTNTQLGGWIAGNPWLSTGSARVILNEVNSSNPSQLRGYVEVAGDRAQVVIANPSGVTCDGCGFLNAHRATLTTGTPIINNGNLDGYLVQGGAVVVQGTGMDASQTDFADIIARSVQINAGIWASALNVTAGANQVGADNTQTIHATASSAAPAFAIDVAQLGGMYAGKIRLIGTEAGVGVRNAGQIGASAGEVIVTVDGRLENKGSITGNGNSALTVRDLINQGGTVQVAGSSKLTIHASGTVDNGTQGKLGSGGDLHLVASTVINTQGEINAGGTLQASVAGDVNNKQGALIAGQNLTVDSSSLSGDGALLSEGDLAIDLASDFTHAGQFQANGNVVLETTGKIINKARLFAGESITLKAAGIDNQASGEISVGTVNQVNGSINTVRLTATGMDGLTNRGLIDGEATLVKAGSLSNLGAGRIYGDHVAIEANTLTNDAETIDGVTKAAVIASRDRLDIGAQTINNREHALIFSAGDMAIGGSLDADHQAAGQANVINNNSATVETLSSLYLSAKQVNNTNEHFSTQVVEVSRDYFQEFQLAGSPNRYTANQIVVYNDQSDHLATPEGNGSSWNRYDGTRVITETQIKESDPGNILSGGSMQITADAVVNDKSRIIAGGTMTGNIGTLTNTEVAGQRTITDEGSVTSFWREYHKGTDSTGSSTSGYTPPATIQAISLRPAVYQQNAIPTGSGTQIGEKATGSVLTGLVNANAPYNSLFGTPRNPDASYLVETDPRFADYRMWLSSDYMLQQLSIDPTKTHKRLGDGFYEQKLVREQVAQLTGRRFLDGYASDEAQYRALIDNGVTVARQWNLIPGVALTAEQVAALTSDIVWLVEKEVTLTNGQVTKALVPQVYVRVKDGDLDGSGALIAGKTVNLNLSGDLTNAGTIAGRDVVSLTAENIKNLGGRISGTDTAVRARTDLDNLGGIIEGADSLTAVADRDLNAISTTSSQASTQGTRTNIDRVAGLYVSNPGGTLIATAGRDANLMAAQVVNAGQGGSTTIAAGNNLNLGTVAESSTQTVVWDDKNYRHDATRQDVGTNITAKGGIHLSAGNDLNAKAASVTSDQGPLVASAGRNVNITAGEVSRSVDEAHQHTGSNGAFSKKTITTRDTLDETIAQGTTFSGNTAYIQAGTDINVKGSNVVSTAGTALVAGNDVHIEAATNTSSESHFRDEKKSGLFSAGIGFTIGTQQQSMDAKNTSTTAAVSTVGTIQGDVNIQAGNAYRQIGSNVVAPQGDIDIAAKKVDILEAQNVSQSTQETKFKQTGLTVAVTSPVISAIQTVQQMKSAASQTSDGRMQALAGATSALAAKNAYDAVAQNPSQAGGINLSISIGSSKSQSNTVQNSSTAAGSTIAAGGDINIVASGAGKESDVTIQGSTVKAGNDVTLKADDAINLLAAKNTDEQHSTNQLSSGSIGISVGTSGVGVTASATKGRGNADGSDVTWTNTHVEAGNKLVLESGDDTHLKGAVANGKQVVAEVGGNLHIESLQDTSTYDSKQSSAGGSLTIGAGVSGSVNFGKSNINSDYASVTEQSGIKAGDGGFQVQVSGNTDLKGAVIASTDKAVQDGKNQLDTATFTQSDIHNHADYKGQSVGLGLGYSTNGQGVGKDQQGNAQTGGSQTPGTTLPSLDGFSATPPVAVSASDDASSTTHSGISGASIGITDEAKQKELTGKDAATTVASINRDVSTDRDTANALKPIFNEQEIKAGFEIVDALVRETGTFLVNRAKEVDQARQAAKDKDAQADAKEQEMQLLPDGDEKTRLQQEAQIARAQAIAARLEAQEIEQKWGPGGTYRQVMTAVTAAAGGNVAANGSQFVQSTIVNLVQSKAAEGIKQLADDFGIPEGSPAHAALHAINACIGAATQAGNCGAAALGAASASVVGALLAETQGDAEKLSNEQKEARQALVNTLVTGVAAATGNAVAANTAALIEMENNSNVKNAVKAAINDAKDYLGAKAKQGGEKIGDLLEKLEIKTLVEKRDAIKDYLDKVPEKGGLTESEIAVLGIIYAANAALFPTSVLDVIPGAGKAVGKAGDLIKAGVRAEDAAKIASAELKATGATKYVPNAGAVGNMQEFFKKPGFGSDLKDVVRKKNNYQVQGQNVYEATSKVGDNIKKGDLVYLDAMHKNHLEVFKGNGEVRAVLNLDGTINRAKTDAAIAEGRRLRLK